MASGQVHDTGIGGREEYQTEAAEQLVSKLTSQTADVLDMELVKQLKEIVKGSDKRVGLVFDLLLEELKSNHSQKRLLAVQLSDIVYMRSKVFRERLDQNVQLFLQLTVAFSIDSSLPPPRVAAARLKRQSLGFVRKWAMAHGTRHRQMGVAYRYLKDQLKLDFPPEDSLALDEVGPDRRAQEESERQRRTQHALRDSFQQLKVTFDDEYADILRTLQEIKSCLELLAPLARGAKVLEEPLDTIEWEDDDSPGSCPPETLSNAPLAPPEEQDNEAVETALADAYRTLIVHSLPKTTSWLSLLSRAQLDPSEQGIRDQMLRKVVALRESIQRERSKCESYGGTMSWRKSKRRGSGSAAADTSRRNEGRRPEPMRELTKSQQLVDPTYSGKTSFGRRPLGGLDRDGQQTTRHPGDCRGTRSVDRRDVGSPGKDYEGCLVDDERAAKRQKLKGLLKIAPAVKNSAWVQEWGKEEPVTISGWVSRGMEISGHWGRIEGDELTLPPSSLEKLGARAVFFDSLDAPGAKSIANKEEEGPKGVNNTVRHDRSWEALKAAKPNEQDGLGKSELRGEKARLNARQTRRQQDRAHFENVLKDIGMAYERRADSTVSADERVVLHEAIKVMDKEENARMRKKGKHKYPVRERLARKVLGGSTSWATAQCVENERNLKYKERFANEWEDK